MFRPEIIPPTINNIQEEDLSVNGDWVTAKQLTISGTENYCGTVRLNMFDSMGNKYLNNVSVKVNGGQWSYKFIPEIEADEQGLEFTISATDSLGNQSSKKIIFYNTDKKPPTLVSEKETTKEWSKTKDIVIDTTDFGARDVFIAFNDTDDYQLAERNENNFTRPYTMTGDVYGSTVAAVYAKDGLGNTRTEFITIHNLDNTAPTVTKAVSERQGIRNAVVTVAANDINTKLNASGSGVAGYAITQNTEQIPDAFQTENTFNLTKSGTWYVWAVDAVGNISEPVPVDVKIEYTVSLDANGGTLTGDSSYQIISGETVTIPEPVREGYTFTGWTVDGTGSSVSGNDFTMGSEDADIIANWQINQYEVDYIDAVDSTSGKHLGSTKKLIDYNSQVRGSDIGNNTADNAYYNGYYYVSDTADIVTINGATVYRIFALRTVSINGTISWNDHENAYHTRPESSIIRLYRDGIEIDSIIVNTADTVNRYAFKDLQKYSFEDGHAFHYEVKQDTVWSQASLEHTEDKYTTIQDGYDFLNGIQNTERPIKPGFPDEPVNPDDKGLYAEGIIYWDDNDDSLGLRPSTVTVMLYQKGEDGEWKLFDKTIVDTHEENHYLFDWLPKYWYDGNGMPTVYEYKTEETFTSWHVEDDEIKDTYTIIPDKPNDNDFTNQFNFTDKPVIPVNEYVNTITVRTNTDEQVRIILRPSELFIHDDYSVSYGEPSGNDIPVMADNAGTPVSDLPGTRYEVVLDSNVYVLEDLTLFLGENMELEKIDDRWYITIKNVPGNVIGTLDAGLSLKEQHYQTRQKFMNYFSVTMASKTAESVIRMSNTVIMAIPEDLESTVHGTDVVKDISITYLDSDTEDRLLYSAGDEAEILGYFGSIQPGYVFKGWTEGPDASEAIHEEGDKLVLEENLTLYPVFSKADALKN